MEIFDIFAPELFAFKFDNITSDEYTIAITNWNNNLYLINFYEKYSREILDNQYFNVSNIEEFILFIKKQSQLFAAALKQAFDDGEILGKFEILSKGKNLYEILPFMKSRQQVLRFYGIRLGGVMVIAGSAIKLTLTNGENDLTAQQMLKLQSCQDFLRDNSISDEETFFDYLSELTDD